jgi:hypothetical protein
VLAHLQGSKAADPFDGSPLSPDMLEPCDELRAQIEEWKMEKQVPHNPTRTSLAFPIQTYPHSLAAEILHAA